jgi:uroporphyrinogen decarboxylase
MNARERFLATLRFQPIDRPFRWETFGMWPETLDRWYQENLDASLKQPLPGDQGAIYYDEYLRVLVRGFMMDRVDYLRDVVVSGFTETPFYPPFERRVLEDDGHTRVVEDTDGILKREFSSYSTSSMPQFLKYPVANRDDFIQLLPRMDPDHPGRLSTQWAEVCGYYARCGFPVGFTVCGAFGHPRNLFGVENLCVAYYEQPTLIHEIMEHWTDFYIRLASRVWEGVRFDFVYLWEDMAYKGGSIISPRLVCDFLLPYYRRFIDHVRGLGCEVFIVDSDGDVTQLVPLFISVGVNAMLPFEVQAGMDVRFFRRQYGKDLAIIGGLDKRSLTRGPVAIEEELRSRMLPMLASGGYIPSLDHTVPPDVSLADFQYFIDRSRALSEEA